MELVCTCRQSYIVYWAAESGFGVTLLWTQKSAHLKLNCETETSETRFQHKLTIFNPEKKLEQTESQIMTTTGNKKLHFQWCLLVTLSFIQLAHSSIIKVGKQEKSFLVPNIQVVNEYAALLGEGPYWDKENNNLYYVDTYKGDYLRLNVVTKQLDKITVGDLVSIIIPYQNEPGTFIVSRRNELLKLNWNLQNTTVVATVSSELEGKEWFNDAKCDARGRLFIGSVLQGEDGGVVDNGGNLYRLDGNEFTKVTTGYNVANGMAWSNDANHTKFFLNDSRERKIYAFDYNIETGTVANKRILIDCDQSPDFVAGEQPDGMVIDEFGFLWICMIRGGRIVKIDVDTARVVDQVSLPNNGLPTSMARGFYEGRDGLYVTTAQNEISPKPDDGKILHISFQGAQVNTFVP